MQGGCVSDFGVGRMGIDSRPGLAIPATAATLAKTGPASCTQRGAGLGLQNICTNFFVA